MTRFISACCLVLLFACGDRREAPAGDAMGDAMGDAAAADGAALAGNWTVRVLPADKDTTLLTFKMTTTAGTDGWTMDFPDRPTVPVRVVSRDEDGAVIEAGPYESAFRKGVQVNIRSEMRLEGDKLVGNTTAHYDVSTPDSVVELRLEGTRE